MERIEPVPLAVTAGGRRVPAVLWERPGRDAPLVQSDQ